MICIDSKLPLEIPSFVVLSQPANEYKAYPFILYKEYNEPFYLL